ncbi:hypothetical protein ACFXKC_51435 [Streptomyces sp. NPDC059340]|uniref:protein kinase domain-containing protein n=1 Tax=Streptomyces sp. NPDC059340 TaxID=3346806 RepID=UPI00367AF324
MRGNPHVVTVYDTVIDGGLPRIVMEYVPGARDLEAGVGESGPLSPAETARLGLALLDAPTAGHELGIPHRDVKPSNVLLTSHEPEGHHDAGLGRVLLSDYGISLQQGSGEPRLTSASGIVGTPGLHAAPGLRGGALLLEGAVAAGQDTEGDDDGVGAMLFHRVPVGTALPGGAADLAESSS